MCRGLRNWAAPQLLLALVAAWETTTQHARGAAQAAVGPDPAAAAAAVATAAAPSQLQHVKVLGDPLEPPLTGFLAALMYEGALFCGGSLVAPTAVLTAAHCMDDGGSGLAGPEGISVRLNWPDLRLPAPAGAEEHAVARVVAHPAYNASGDAPGDILLLLLATPSALPPIVLPPPGLNLTKGQAVWAAGYSAEGEDFGTLARWFYARVFPPAACSRIWQEWGKEQSDGGAWNASAGTLCSGLQVDDAGVCAGDSGGPLVLGDEADDMALIGVLSWGTGASPCAPGSHEINAWASLVDPAQRAWVDAELHKLGPAPAPAAAPSATTAA